MSWSPIASRGGARSGRGGEAPRLGELENTLTTEQKIIREPPQFTTVDSPGPFRVGSQPMTDTLDRNKHIVTAFYDMMSTGAARARPSSNTSGSGHSA